MCGIAGIIDYQQPDVDARVVEDMLDVIRYRGPDGDGIQKKEFMAFGHVRLSIIDLSGGKQPLTNEDETLWITFNGEIYNYKSLRTMLIEKKHQFRTNSDTETLAHLYEEYGEKMLDHLQGMFAFAIWNTKTREAFIARDRIGIKPLFYYHAPQKLFFASEIKSLLRHPEVQKELDIESLGQYFTYRSVPAPKSLFKGVRKLLPGHYLKISQNDVQQCCYWDVSNLKPNLKESSDQEILERVEILLKKSIERRLVSDVPVGSFLSGGLDSSLIVALMSRQTNLAVKTYSVGFENFIHSEVSHAQKVAEHCKTDHHELILKEDCFAEHLEELIWTRDAPLSEPADIPLYLLAKMARKEVKVLLSGEGADELFAGYPKYAFDKYSPYVSIMPQFMIDFAAKLLPQRYRRLEIALKNLGLKKNDLRWAHWFSPFNLKEKGELNIAFKQWENPSSNYSNRLKEHSSLAQMLYTDCKIWLPDNLLDRGDRMTMRASVEGRVPFLDHELVEYAFTLPDSVKIKNFSRKWIIKEIARKYIPHEIIDRPKVGFAVPLAQWFRGELKNLCYDTLLEQNGLVKEYLDKNYVQNLLDEHVGLKKDHAIKIWTLLGASIWYQQFFTADADQRLKSCY